jgi:hypothetical protein
VIFFLTTAGKALAFARSGSVKRAQLAAGQLARKHGVSVLIVRAATLASAKSKLSTFIGRPRKRNPSRTSTARYRRAGMSASTTVQAPLYRSKRNRKQRRAAARFHAGRSSRAQFQHTLDRHNVRAVGKRRRVRRNPAASPALERAGRVFERWHGFAPSGVQRLRTRATPRTLVQLGELVEVVYRSDKWSGKPQLYRHKTKRPHPRLCTGPDARGLYLLGGKTRVTERGLVD